jgi:hypothetical protein
MWRYVEHLAQTFKGQAIDTVKLFKDDQELQKQIAFAGA